MDRRTFIQASVGAGGGLSVAWAAKAAAGRASSDTPSRSAARVIDVHAHFVPDIYRSAAVAAGHAHPDGMPALPEWSADGMLGMMDRLGIALAVLSISSPGVHFGDDRSARRLAREVNIEGARVRKAHPQRFGQFASLPLPDVAGALDEIAYAFDTLGADGVILESNSNGIYPGDAELEPVFAELDRRGAVVLMHPTSPHCPCCVARANGLPRPVLEFMFETARAVTNLILSGTLSRFRKMKVIVPHAGGTMPVLADRVALVSGIIPGMNKDGADVLETLGRLYYDLAGAPVPRLLPALLTFADPRKLLYGSDWPFTPESKVAMLRSELDEFLSERGDLLHQIRSSNAEALFPRLGSSERTSSER